MKGLPASGKSTWAKAQEGFKRINRDDLRSMIDNGVWSKENEEIIVAARDALIEMFIAYGHNIVVDDTNLDPSIEKHLREFATSAGYEFEVKDFTDVPLYICQDRNRKRTNPVPDEAIMRMYKKYVAIA